MDWISTSQTSDSLNVVSDGCYEFGIGSLPQLQSPLGGTMP